MPRVREKKPKQFQALSDFLGERDDEPLAQTAEEAIVAGQDPEVRELKAYRREFRTLRAENGKIPPENEKRAMQLVLKAYKILNNVRVIGPYLGVSASTVTKWEDKNPKFARAYREAGEYNKAMLEATAYWRARHESDGLLKFMMSAMMPDKYGNRVNVDGRVGIGQDPNAGPVQLMFSEAEMGPADIQAPGMTGQAAALLPGNVIFAVDTTKVPVEEPEVAPKQAAEVPETPKKPKRRNGVPMMRAGTRKPRTVYTPEVERAPKKAPKPRKNTKNDGFEAIEGVV